MATSRPQPDELTSSQDAAETLGFIERATAALREHFGYTSFRAGQSRVLQAIAERRDCLAVMPTGSGKSLCYQIPALVREGVTLVVSPLIALMKDQVDGLRLRGIAVTGIDSTLEPAEQRARIRRMRDAEVRLVYVAPERFRAPGFRDALRDTPVSLLAIDEAHCISQWGHDFRPDYRRLREVRQLLGGVQTIALTATATPEVQDDIARELDMRDPARVVTGFDRPNLRYTVTRANGDAAKLDELTRLIERLIDEHDGDGVPSGLIYAGTRKQTERIAEHLASIELPGLGARSGDLCRAYHAGLPDEERHSVQDDFMEDRLPWVAATNAFGMGVDKPDIRFVVHFQIPGSVEAYYQEVGRAGRDGRPSECLLLFDERDRFLQEFFIDGANPPRELIASVESFLWSLEENPILRTATELEKLYERLGAVQAANPMAFRSAITLLERVGAIERPYLHDLGGDGPASRSRAILLPAERRPLAIDSASLERKRRREEERLRRVLSYARLRECRRNQLLRHFGEDVPSPACGSCDVCRSEDGCPPRELSEEEFTIVRKVLSGVARAQGRCGKRRVVQMLIGSRAKAVKDLGLDSLSTWGILRGTSESALRELIDVLEGAELVAEEGRGRFSIVRLTSRGVRVMKDEERVELGFPPELLAPSRSYADAGATLDDDELTGDDARLFEALRRLRREVARELGIPPYRVFHDRTLREMARRRPRSRSQLLGVPGVGTHTLERFGEVFLEAIARTR